MNLCDYWDTLLFISIIIGYKFHTLVINVLFRRKNMMFVPKLVLLGHFYKLTSLFDYESERQIDRVFLRLNFYEQENE